MTKGVCIVATGDYKPLALDCLKHTMKHCPYPVLLYHEGENRDIKTNLIHYTPFDYTIFLDADSLVQRPGIEEMFIRLESADIVLNPYVRWPAGTKRIFALYKHAMQMFKCTLPITVYNGALFSFKKNERTLEFFAMWNEYWQKFGKEREMPPLACAIKNSNVIVSELPAGYFAADKFESTAVVQHWYNGFAKRFNTAEKIKPVFKMDTEAAWRQVVVAP